VSDIRPPLAAALSAFGLPAAISPPGAPAVETTVVWLPSTTTDTPTASDFRRAEAHRVLAFPVADVPEVPRETLISAPEYLGGERSDWQVDEVERIDYDHWRATVLPAS
jgi:hypothetical protein